MDTHTIHTHLFHSQLINRVDQSGQVTGGTLPVDPIELGWKDTLRINPLEVTFIALRPVVPTPAQIPFEVPNSIRLIDPTLPEGAPLISPPPAGWFDPQANPIDQILNHFVNFGWEYVWHCHILSHEEMDMMHSLVFAVPPIAPSNLVATSNAGAVDLAWTDNSRNETDWVIQTATSSAGPWSDSATAASTTGPTTGPMTYPGVATANWYRVLASNVVGDTTVYTPAVGFPTMTAISGPSGIAAPGVTSYSISGTVTKAGGLPVAGVTISLTGAATATTTTAADGAYVFTGLANGSYTVTPSMGTNTFTPASSPVTINNTSVSGVNFTMNTYSISGTVTKAGGLPVAGVTISLTGAATATTTTVANGTYTFTGLANGSYTVTPSMGTNTFTPASSPAVVNNANVAGVNFTLNTYSISGTVTISGDGPAAGVTMSLTGAATATTTTAANGTYTFTGLANGSYTVTPSMGTNTFTPASSPAVVNNANVTGVNFTMTLTTFSISGTVTLGATGLGGVTMTLSGAANRTTTTAADGTYSFTGLVNGGYTVTPSLSGYVFTPGNRPVNIAGANVTGQNFSVSAYLAVTVPNGGENWAAGTTQAIRWTYTGTPGSFVRIELLKGGVLNRTISTGASLGTGGNGSFNWLIPSNQTIGNDYAIRITSATNAAFTDVSNANFSITGPTITVAVPNGGENWAAGTTQAIRWTYTGTPGSFVRIELLKGGVLNRTISTGASLGTGGNGSFNWLIPSNQTIGNDYAIRITSATNAAFTDVSNANFSITGPTITVAVPNGGENWAAGTTQAIRWTYTGTPGSFVRIELLKGGVLNRTISTGASVGTGGNGSFNWAIPSNQTAGTDYIIRLTSTTNSAATDVSNANFTISAPPPPTVTVATPNGGENWRRNTVQTINWNYTGNVGTRLIIYLLQGGNIVRTITENAYPGFNGAGTYSWFVPSNLALAGNYRIRIMSATNQAVTDTSDADFSIIP